MLILTPMGRKLGIPHVESASFSSVRFASPGLIRGSHCDMTTECASLVVTRYCEAKWAPSRLATTLFGARASAELQNVNIEEAS